MAIIESNNTETVVNVILNGGLATQFTTSEIKNLNDLDSQIANQGVNTKSFDFADRLGNMFTTNSKFELGDELVVNMVKREQKAGGYREDKAIVKNMVNDPVNGAKVKDAIKTKYGKNYTQLKADQMADIATNGILEPKKVTKKKVTKKKLSKKKVATEVKTVSEPTKKVLEKATKECLPSPTEMGKISSGQLLNAIRLVNPDPKLLIIVESLQDMFKQGKCDFKTFSGIKALK